MNTEKIENQLKSTGPTEHILNIFKATLATLPFTGGISSLISDYIPSQRFLRLEEFTQNIAKDLITYQSEINDKYILSDEFAYIFEKSFKGAVENYQKEKINAFKAILINSLKDFEITQEEKEYYLSLVENLSTLHIQILTFLAFPKNYLKENKILETEITGRFKNFFPVVIPNVSIDVIKLAFQDLYNYGFLNTDSGIFSTMTASSGWNLLGDRVTNNGRRFISFINLEKE